jgi:hypothetical protein
MERRGKILIAVGCAALLVWACQSTKKAQIPEANRPLYEKAYKSIVSDSAGWRMLQGDTISVNNRASVSKRIKCSIFQSFVGDIPSTFLDSIAGRSVGDVKYLVGLDKKISDKIKCGNTKRCGGVVDWMNWRSGRQKYRVYFSSIQDGLLYAELVRVGNGDGCYKDVARYTEAVSFVFYFEENQIQRKWRSGVISID